MWSSRRIWLSWVISALVKAQILTWDTTLTGGHSHIDLPPKTVLLRVLRLEPPLPYRYDTSNHRLGWEGKADTIRIVLRLLRLPGAGPLYEPLPAAALAAWDSLQAASYQPQTSLEADSLGSRLRRSGSLIRSITVGSGQNATLNSAFRLNLEGPIAPDLAIIAALTDENLPFQTATQTFSDFDRVFIGLRWKAHQLLLGDLELRQSQTRFANFYRNVLGLEATLHHNRYEGRLALAEAKGRFHTNSFMGQEGRQGPYLLTGKNNERFIVILAGSEKVYVNGQLMQRGPDRDYLIDYTTGEITFTPRVPITAATRIVVDFEYADRSYGRTFVWTTHHYQSERLRAQVSYFRQADNPRRPLDFSLTPTEEAYLAQLPPGSTVGILKGVDTLPFERGSIRYAARDTLINGTPYTYFVFSQDSTQAFYQVSFVYVGPGRGEYIRAPASVNGNVFVFVGPSAGDYRVGRAVPLPTQLEVVTLLHTYNPASRLYWEQELDLSRYIENRFSGQRQVGVATRQRMRYALFSDSAAWQVIPSMAFQYVEASYQNADRVYEREYGRLWNFNDLGARARERLWEAEIPITWRKRYTLTPQAGLRHWGDTIKTYRQSVRWEGLDSTRGLGGTYLLENLATLTPHYSDHWLRHTGRLFWTQGALRLGTELWLENRRRTVIDTLSFRFYDYTPFLELQGAKRWTLKLSYNFRREWQAVPEASTHSLRPRFRAYMPRLSLTHQGKKLSFSTQSSYRIFIPGDTTFRLTPNRTLLSQNSLRYRNAPIEVELFYQLSSEQTPQRQLIYVGVNPGQGTHEWRDFNGDGIQQLEEFVPAANPILANYVPVIRATGAFFATTALTSALTFQWQPQKPAWLSTLTNLRLEQRQVAQSQLLRAYLPQLRPKADTSLPQWNALLRQDVFLLRQNPRGDQTFSLQYNRNQQVPLSGLVAQTQWQLSSRTRYNFSRFWGSEWVLTRQFRQSLAERQAELNYAFRSWEASVQLIYQPSGRWRSVVGTTYRQRRLPDNRPSLSWRLPLEQRYSWKPAAFLSLRLEVAYFRLPDNLSPVLRFELLDGLQPGLNFLCAATLNIPLSRFLELNALYDGRFSQQKPLHSARMQIRANF